MIVVRSYEFSSAEIHATRSPNDQPHRRKASRYRPGAARLVRPSPPRPAVAYTACRTKAREPAGPLSCLAFGDHAPADGSRDRQTLFPEIHRQMAERVGARGRLDRGRNEGLGGPRLL